MTYYDLDDEERGPRIRTPRSTGCNPLNGVCGAPDCPRCHPEWQGYCAECGWRGYWDEDMTECPSCGAEAGE